MVKRVLCVSPDTVLAEMAEILGPEALEGDRFARLG